MPRDIEHYKAYQKKYRKEHLKFSRKKKKRLYRKMRKRFELKHGQEKCKFCGKFLTRKAPNSHKLQVCPTCRQSKDFHILHK